MESKAPGGAGSASNGSSAPGEPSLLTAPPEILDRIAIFIDNTDDFFSIRLTCKKVVDAVHQQFKIRFFYQKSFMVTEQSLQVLVDISRHPTLSPALRQVVIGLDHYRPAISKLLFRSSAHAMSFYKGAGEQGILIGTGRAHNMLVDAFRNLPNLNTAAIGFHAGIDGFDDTTPPGSRARLLRSHGSKAIQRETGKSLDSLHRERHQGYSEHDFAEQVFQILLSAVAESGIRLSTLGGHPGSVSRGLSDAVYHIPRYLESSVTSLLGGLKRFYLSPDFCVKLHPEDGTDLAQVASFPLLQRFLGLMPNLTHLGVAFLPSTTGYQMGSRFFHYLGGDSHGILFPSLEVLSIKNAITHSTPLLKACTRFPTLKSLSLERINFDTSPEVSDETEAEEDLWPHFFKDLASSVSGRLPRLERFRVCGVTAGYSHIPLHFMPVPSYSNGSERIWVWSEGLSASAFLEATARDCEYDDDERPGEGWVENSIQGFGYDPYDDDDGDDDDDDDNDDDDDEYDDYDPDDDLYGGGAGYTPNHVLYAIYGN